MNQETLSKMFLHLRMELDQSLRYCAVMCARYARWASIAQSLEVILSVSTFVTIARRSPIPLKAALAFVDIVWKTLSVGKQSKDHAAWYRRKRKSFADLMGRIPLDEEQFSVKTLESLTQERLMLEADVFPNYGCLSVLCHNEVCEDVGMPECKRELTWMQRHIWRFFPVSYKPPTKDKDHERKEFSGD